MVQQKRNKIKPPRARLDLRPLRDPRVFDHLWTIDDVAYIFGVTTQSVYNWRVRHFDPLPFITIKGGKRDNIRFHRHVTLAWARRNGKIARRLPEGALTEAPVKKRR